MKTLINGRPMTDVPASDRGLLFGDGLFETMGFWQGRCPLWTLHMRRLQRGCRALGISPPDPARVEAECQGLAESQARVVIRLTLTRGSGGRGYWPDAKSEPTRILQCRDWPERQAREQQRGLTAITSSLRISIQPALAGLKHCNRIEQVLAARACQRHGVDEALVFDQNGHLAEGVSSNLLIRYQGAWMTPDSPAAVAGVGLEWLLENPPLAIGAGTIDAAQVDRADSILMINSIGGVRPLSHLDQRRLIIDEDCRCFQRHWNQNLIPVCDDC